MVLEETIVKYASGLENVDTKELAPLEEHGPKQLAFYRGEKVFLIIQKETKPLRIEIRCDRRLSKTLQERYESVLQGKALGRNGTVIICSGQLMDDEVIDLVRHSYEITENVE